MKKGKQVASSKNLEVILRYQRKHSSIKSAEQIGYNLHVRYNDGATVKTKFASKDVLTNWIYKKRKSGVFPTPKRWYS